MQKNDVVQVVIEDMTNEGAGIGKVDGYPLFIKDALIGDEVEAKVMKAKKTYGYARLMKIRKPSKDRVTPPCPVARQCGGCQIQAMSYEAQLQFKQKKVENHLKRIGGFQDIQLEPIIGMEYPFRYRNKAQFPIGRNKEGRLVAGFYAGRTHSIIENRDCLLGVEENKEILDLVLGWMEKNKVEPYDETTGTGLIRHCLIRKGFKTGQLMVCLIANGRKLPKAESLVEALIRLPGMTSITLNVNQERTNVILGKELIPIWGKNYIEDDIGDIRYQISPLSFFQVNPVQTEKLYGKALEYAGLTGNEIVWDLYCGIGTISLFLAKKAKKVFGVEIVPEAIEDARNNAKRNGISNAEFFVGKAEEVVPEKYRDEAIQADVVVLDPPRKGCEEELLETIVKMEPKRIVYVSCDSATLARDLKVLCGRGYEVVKGGVVDQFGNTTHVETVVLMSKVKE